MTIRTGRTSSKRRRARRMRTAVTVAVVVMLLAMLGSWVRSEQVHREQRLYLMAEHGAEAVDALERLQVDPADAYQRHRAAVHLWSLHADLLRLSQWAGEPLDPDARIRLYQELLDGTADPDAVAALRTELRSAVKQVIDGRQEDRFLTRGDVVRLVGLMRAPVLEERN